MLQTIIGKAGVTYAAKRSGGVITNAYELPLLAVGAIAIFDEDGALVPADATSNTLVNSKTFRIAVGQVNPESGAMITTPIHKNAFNQTFGAYVAPIAQVIKIGQLSSSVGSTGLPSVLIPDMDAEVVISTNMPNYNTYEMPKRYTTRVKGSDSATGVFTRLIAAINKDESSEVTASPIVVSSVTTGITLTSKVIGKSYQVGTAGILEDCTVYADGTNGSVLMKAGRGTYELVAASEKEAMTHQGDAFRHLQHDSWFKVKTLTTEGATYNSWTISQATTHVSPTMRYKAGTNHYQIFTVVGSPLATTLATLLPNIFGDESISDGAEPTSTQPA